MSFSIESKKCDLNYIKKRIEETDLTPGIDPIKTHLLENINILSKHGINNLDDLLFYLKDKKKLSLIAEKTGINADYLVLLRREINAWIAAKIKMTAFIWLNTDIVKALNKDLLSDSEKVFNALNSKSKLQKFSEKHDLDISQERSESAIYKG